jgi:hypothetical protein
VPVKRPKPGGLVESDTDAENDEIALLCSLLTSREILEFVFLCLLRDAVSRSVSKNGSSVAKPKLAHKSGGDSKSAVVALSIESLNVFERLVSGWTILRPGTHAE